MVEQAEQMLMDLGFTQVRVRIHGRLARIELEPESIGRFVEAKIRACVSRTFHELGFLYVTLDLDGYQSGSMNKGL